MKNKIVYVDMDGVLCDFKGAFQTKRSENPDIKYPQSQYGFFRNLLPMPGALDAMNELKRNEKIDLYILTAPSIYNPLSYSEKREWVEKHLGMDMVKKLIISPHKGLNKGDYLIDDNNTGSGQDSFEGELIHFGTKRFSDWNKVTAYLAEDLKHA